MASVDDESTILLPPKKKRHSNFEQCVICQNSTGQPLRKAKETSLQKLIAALKMREDDVFERLKPDIGNLSNLPVRWHHSCYATCTSVTNLRHVQRRKSPSFLTPENVTDETTPDSCASGATPRLSRSQIPSIDWSNCLFCKKKTHKKVKDMVTTATFEACRSIRQAAEVKGDDDMLLVLPANNDLIAAEAKYHKACYATYVSSSNIKFKAFREGKDEDAYATAFSELAAEITSDIKAGRAFTMGFLLTKYKALLQKTGLPAESYTSQRLKLRLKKHFAEEIVFHQPPDRSKSELLYSSHISLQDVINAAYEKVATAEPETSQQKEGLAELNKDERTRMLYHTAKLIQEDISHCQGISAKPPNIHDITLECSRSMIPGSLYWILRWIITNSGNEIEDDLTSKACISEADERRVLMIAQDVVHCASHGRIKMPKHVSLGMSIRHLTGSKQLVTMLNRMGHCISYDDVEVIDTSLAKEVLARSELTGVIVPTNITPGGFVQVAGDNNDINEETLDGKSTTHATTLVLFQNGLFGPTPHRKVFADHSQRKRSLESTGRCQSMLEFSAHGKRPVTQKYRGKVKATWFTQTSHPSSQMDFAWALIRMCPTKLFEVELNPVHTEEQKVPSWSGFHALVHSCVPAITNVGYCPMIDGSPTELTTVYTVMKNVKAMMESLGQKDSVITFDLAIYVKAKEIQWRRPKEFVDMVIRMGGFHIALNYLSLLGKKYGGSGIEDMLIESGVYGTSTTEVLLKGKSYNRGVRAHKLMMEAFFRLQWRSFNRWLPNSDSRLNREALAAQITECREAVHQGVDVKEELEKLTEALAELEAQFITFKTEARSQSHLFAFWDDYIVMVRMLLKFIRAERTSDWHLHLMATAEMTPLFFAMDRPNYSRWLPVYLIDMHELQETHPAVYQEFMEGNHAISRSGHPFAQVWTDMALEQSINLDSKTIGGIIGISQKPGALERWFLTSHERATITTALKEMCGLQDEDRVGTHKDASVSRKKRDEEDVVRLISTVTSGLVNDPFYLDGLENGDDDVLPLINIATGVVMPATDAQRILQCYELGKTQMEVFVEERLNSSETLFWDAIPSLKIKTFETLSRRKNVKTVDDKMFTIAADRDLFGRLIISAKSRDINLKKVLSYELSTVPYSLAHADGTLRKTTKSALLTELEKKVDVQPNLPRQTDGVTTAYMMDGMASVQMMKSGGAATFGELAEKHFNLISAPFSQHGCTRVDVVFDRYVQKSIKDGERSRRGETTALEIKISGPTSPVPKHWAKYIANPQNKKNLCAFLGDTWCMMAQKQLQRGQMIVLGGCFKDVEKTLQVTKEGCEYVPPLLSDHEEADTRILLHAKHAAETHNRIVIQSPDTDVAVLSVAHFQNLGCSELWFKTGVRDKSRFIPIHILAPELGSQLCDSLLPLHALTGCDSTSALSGLGKKKAFTTLCASDAYQKSLCALGYNDTMDQDIISGCEAFVCSLYTENKKAGSQADSVRYWMFCQKGHKNDGLPPTSDSFRQHLERVNFQSLVWRRALERKQDLPTPEGHGWTLSDDGRLQPILMKKEPAPKGLVEIIACHCQTSCRRSSCSCRTVGLSCTEACSCMAEDCHNFNTTHHIYEDFLNDD